MDVGCSTAAYIVSFSAFVFLSIFDLDLIIFFQTLFWLQCLGGWVVLCEIGVNWDMNFSILLIPVGLNVGLTGVTPLWTKTSYLCGRQSSFLGSYRVRCRRASSLDILKVKSLVMRPSHLGFNLRGLYCCVFPCRVSCKLKLHLFVYYCSSPQGRGHGVKCHSELLVQWPYTSLWPGTSAATPHLECLQRS